MAKRSKTKCIGILTSGGDCPGLNAAIRAIAKPAMNEFGMKVIGIQDGFRGLVQNRVIELDNRTVSGILTLGGTILGTSREKPHKMRVGGQTVDMVDAAVENAHNMQIDCLVCLGGGGTQKNAYRLQTRGGLNVMTLPKTIDNDVAGTDTSFGFDTAVNIATDAIDRLHTTATSHHRIIVCELMGHSAGWVALNAGIAGGADAILMPEIPYSLDILADYLLSRRRHGKRFSIIALAEGAHSDADAERAAKEAEARGKREAKMKDGKKKDGNKGAQKATSSAAQPDGRASVIRKAKDGSIYHLVQEPRASKLARQLQELTGMEARVTSLGHVQRGGSPTPFDRMLCTVLGTRAAELLSEGTHNVMVAYRGGRGVPVPLSEVAGHIKTVPIDHPLVHSARLVGTCFGD